MSVVVTCTIKVEQQTYDIPIGGDIFEESHNISITGSFDVLHPDILSKLIDRAVKGAHHTANVKLHLLKGGETAPVPTKPKDNHGN